MLLCQVVFAKEQDIGTLKSAVATTPWWCNTLYVSSSTPTRASCCWWRMEPQPASTPRTPTCPSDLQSKVCWVARCQVCCCCRQVAGRAHIGRSLNQEPAAGGGGRGRRKAAQYMACITCGAMHEVRRGALHAAQCFAKHSTRWRPPQHALHPSPGCVGCAIVAMPWHGQGAMRLTNQPTSDVQGSDGAQRKPHPVQFIRHAANVQHSVVNSRLYTAWQLQPTAQAAYAQTDRTLLPRHPTHCCNDSTTTPHQRRTATAAICTHIPASALTGVLLNQHVLSAPAPTLQQSKSHQSHLLTVPRVCRVPVPLLLQQPAPRPHRLSHHSLPAALIAAPPCCPVCCSCTEWCPHRGQTIRQQQSSTLQHKLQLLLLLGLQRRCQVHQRLWWVW